MVINFMDSGNIVLDRDLYDYLSGFCMLVQNLLLSLFVDMSDSKHAIQQKKYNKNNILNEGFNKEINYHMEI